MQIDAKVNEMLSLLSQVFTHSRNGKHAKAAKTWLKAESIAQSFQNDFIVYTRALILVHATAYHGRTLAGCKDNTYGNTATLLLSELNRWLA